MRIFFGVLCWRFLSFVFCGGFEEIFKVTLSLMGFLENNFFAEKIFIKVWTLCLALCSHFPYGKNLKIVFYGTPIGCLEFLFKFSWIIGKFCYFHEKLFSFKYFGKFSNKILQFKFFLIFFWIKISDVPNNFFLFSSFHFQLTKNQEKIFLINSTKILPQISNKTLSILLYNTQQKKRSNFFHFLPSHFKKIKTRNFSDINQMRLRLFLLITWVGGKLKWLSEAEINFVM